MAQGHMGSVGLDRNTDRPSIGSGRKAPYVGTDAGR